MAETGPHKSLPRSHPKVRRALSANPDLARLIPAAETTLFEDSKGRIIPPETGSVVVMDIHTGAVRTLVSSPTFDPNVFSGRISSAEWKALIENKRRPLLDRALSGQYSPGSTFKMLVALAALEAGVISEKQHSSAPGIRPSATRIFTAGRNWGMARSMYCRRLNSPVMCSFMKSALRQGLRE